MILTVKVLYGKIYKKGELLQYQQRTAMRKMICFTLILVVMFLLPLESLAAVNGWICPFCDSSTYITRICLDDDVQLGVWLDSNAIWHGDHFDRRF